MSNKQYYDFEKQFLEFLRSRDDIGERLAEYIMQCSDADRVRHLAEVLGFEITH